MESKAICVLVMVVMLALGTLAQGRDGEAAPRFPVGARVGARLCRSRCFTVWIFEPSCFVPGIALGPWMFWKAKRW